MAVAQYPANDYGLYDMAGNVYEWCLDAYDGHFYDTFPLNGVARNPLSGGHSVKWLMNEVTVIGPQSYRVVRGGAWDDWISFVQVGRRSNNLITRGGVDPIGFRCVKDVTP